jgi:UDP-glucuronate decarboxylase
MMKRTIPNGAAPLETPFMSATDRAPRNVLITGGAGFLGSQLCDRHVIKGDRVICLDNLATGRLRNIEHLLDNPRFSFVQQDVVDVSDISEPLHLIYNMACPASPDKYQIDPIQTFKTCVYGGINLLELARKQGARILQASTSEVYGDPHVTPQPEGYWGNVNSFGPRACYDEGKRAVETLFHDYHERHGVDIRIARIFNTYGPRMDPEDGRVVSNFVTQALRGDQITIYGDGSQTRSFCYVDDMVNGLVALMEAPAAVSVPVNIGNPDEFTILELAQLVLDMTGSRSRLVSLPLPIDDPKQRRPDITRAREVLGWQPEVALREGLVPTLSYFGAELLLNSLPPTPEEARASVAGARR